MDCARYQICTSPHVLRIFAGVLLISGAATAAGSQRVLIAPAGVDHLRLIVVLLVWEIFAQAVPR